MGMTSCSEPPRTCAGCSLCFSKSPLHLFTSPALGAGAGRWPLWIASTGSLVLWLLVGFSQWSMLKKQCLYLKFLKRKEDTFISCSKSLEKTEGRGSGRWGSLFCHVPASWASGWQWLCSSTEGHSSCGALSPTALSRFWGMFLP